MDPESHTSIGAWRSLRRMGESVLGLAQSRFELFTVELQQEKLRALNLLIRLAVALTVGVAGLLTAFAALAICLWNTAGYLGLVGLAVAALAVSGGLLWRIKDRMQTGETPFAETVAEFRKDRECLRKEK